MGLSPFLARVLEAHQRAKTAATEADVELAALVKKVDGLKEAESAALRKVDAAKLEVATLAEEVAARLRDDLPAAVRGHAGGGVAAADVPLAGAPRVHPIEAMPELLAALRGIPEWEAKFATIHGQWQASFGGVQGFVALACAQATPAVVPAAVAVVAALSAACSTASAAVFPTMLPAALVPVAAAAVAPAVCPAPGQWCS